MLEIKQSVEVLRRQQRLFRVNADVNYCGMILGQPECFIEFYRHLFCDHSPDVAAFLVESGFHMSGADDRKFMALVYRVCRDILNMKPVVSLSQFFTNGFSVKKIQMATEIIKAMAVLEKDLHRKSVRGRPSRNKTPPTRSGEVTMDAGAAAGAHPSDSQLTTPSLSFKTQRQPPSPPEISTSTRLSGGRPETTVGRQTLRLDSKALLRPTQDSSAISVFTDEDTGDANTADISQHGDSLHSSALHERTETAPKCPFSEVPFREYAKNIEGSRYATNGDPSLQSTVDRPEPRTSWMKDTLDTISKQVDSLVKRVALIETRITTVERRYSSLPSLELQQKPDRWEKYELTELEEKIQQEQEGFPAAQRYKTNYFESVPVRDGDFAPAPTLPQNVCPADTTAAIRNPDRSPSVSDARTKCSVAGDAVDFLLPPKPTTSSWGLSTSPANSSSRDLETYPWLSTHEGDYFLPSGERAQSTSRAIFNNTVLRKSYLRHRISDDSSPMPSYCDPIGLERRHPSYNNSNDSGDCYNKPTSISSITRRTTFIDSRAHKVPTDRQEDPSAESASSGQNSGLRTQSPDANIQNGLANSAKPPLPTITKSTQRLEKENRSPQPEVITAALQSTPNENGLQEQFKRICLMLSETQNLLKRSSDSHEKTASPDRAAQVQHTLRKPDMAVAIDTSLTSAY